MTAFSQALQIALTKAANGGNAKPPVVSPQQAGFTSYPVFAELFRAARASAHASLSLAKAANDQKSTGLSLKILQEAIHGVEEVDRQIKVALDLVSLSLDVYDDHERNVGEGRRVDSWTANIAERARKLYNAVAK